MEEQVRMIMGDILRLNPEAIDSSVSRDNTPSWDSLNHINLITGFEQEFNVAFEVEEIESMFSYDDVIEVLERKLSMQAN